MLLEMAGACRLDDVRPLVLARAMARRTARAPGGVVGAVVGGKHRLRFDVQAGRGSDDGIENILAQDRGMRKKER